MSNLFENTIGLLGGTFDPIHNGHITIAKRLLNDLHLESVRFILNNTPPHRDSPIATPQQRWEMLNLALEYEDKLIPDDTELQRGGVSYMIDTLKSIQSRTTKQLSLILGSDVLLGLNTWQSWQEILKFCKLIIIKRPDYTMPEDPWLNELLIAQSENIVFHDMLPMDISSTLVRNNLKNGNNVATLLPEAVLQYITANKLYSQYFTSQ